MAAAGSPELTVAPLGSSPAVSSAVRKPASRSPPGSEVGGHLEVSATVTNTGDRAGAEVVQLYLADCVAQVARPVKQLIGYAKVRLEPGEAKRATFDIDMDRASFVGRNHERIVEPGEMRVMVGTSSEDLPLRGSFQLIGDLRRVPEGRSLTTPVRTAAVPARAQSPSMS